MNAPKIELGRRVRFHGCFHAVYEGLIVAVRGTPGEHQDKRMGPMTMANPNACTFDLITFDGIMHAQCRESSVGKLGIGQIDLLDKVHGPALIERAYRLIEERKAADIARAAADRADFERREAGRVIVDAPIFYYNGIRDAKGDKLQKAWYSDGQFIGRPDGTICIYARDYDRFSAKVGACFAVANDTDTMTDYFDSDRIHVIPAHPLYPQVKAALEAQQAHRAKRA